MFPIRTRSRDVQPTGHALGLSEHGGPWRRVAGLITVGLAMLIVMTALALAAPSRGVAADKPAPAEPPATERFGLTPTGADPTQPGTRTSFSFSLPAGGQAADRVSLFNYADHATAFQLYANDALDTAEGQLDLKRFDQQPTDAGSWVKL